MYVYLLSNGVLGLTLLLLLRYNGITTIVLIFNRVMTNPTSHIYRVCFLSEGHLSYNYKCRPAVFTCIFLA